MPGDDDPQVADGPQQPAQVWEVRCVSVVEPKYYVEARNATEAQIVFQKRLASGEIVVPGTPQGGPHYAPVSSLPKFDDFEVTLVQDSTGGSLFKVVHGFTGISGTSMSLNGALDAVRLEVDKRKQRAKSFHDDG